ncbi:terminase small subunit [Rhodococcus sp. IEGM 1374]|uniref:terminase small subunit n=1 Tax=Rhodococcus sp. IEGM 1374 TaxID=3082221 RepID=UPI002955860F|nr:terminase small subunit [Rhodococcus sp. IEGM 1374]MDV7992075.1 terminase small subunit [Rhodococcus sp. IEGM 1374]
MADQTTEQDKQPVGRPLKYKTVAELDAAIEAYFDECDPHLAERMINVGVKEDGSPQYGLRRVMTEPKPYTVSGLARSMGIDRDTLINYRKRDAFFGSIAAAYDRVHEYTETQLFGKSSSGASFSLKNNWGYQDRHQVDNDSPQREIPLLQGLAPDELVVEDDEDGDTAQADDSSQEDQQS